MYLDARRILAVLQLLAVAGLSHQRSSPESSSYVAGVVEFSPPLGVTMENKDDVFRRNVDSYGQIASTAAGMGVDILVFPEYGLSTMELPRNPDGTPALSVEVPSPAARVNPCTDTRLQFSAELRALSCAAKENSLYLVVNLPEKQRGSVELDVCEVARDDCLDVFYNTNVAFDRNGTVVARYRKYNMYGENGFNATSEAEYSVFDTDFGVRFGMFICFDIIFEKPSVKLVRDLGVKDIIFPTAWFSELPFLSAVQAQAAWSYGLDVNFLGSGYNYPEVGSTGSGIYAGTKGTLIATMLSTRGSRLLTASVLKKDVQDPDTHVLPAGGMLDLSAGREANDTETEPRRTGILFKKDKIEDYVTPEINSEEQMNATLCHRSLCCDFKVHSQVTNTDEQHYSYRLAVFDGIRSYDGLATGGLQVCAVLPCANASVESCGVEINKADFNMNSTQFLNIDISGEFYRSNTLHMPSTVVDEYLPLPVQNYEFKKRIISNDKIHITMKTVQQNLTLSTFGIYSRNFTLDNLPVS